MEIQRKKQLLSFIDELNNCFYKAVGIIPFSMEEVSREWGEEVDRVSSLVAQGEVFVPVVGGFSAGKSAALNKVIGRQILPENVSPETAIPAELHYSESEYIRAQTISGEWRNFGIDEMTELSSMAEMYQVLKVYVDSKQLKDIEPLILVDMPGFDSGLEKHQQAILRYISSGALYLFMVEAKSGTISRQSERRINEIVGLERSIKVFLSKTDLVSPKELESIHQYVSEQVESIIGDHFVGRINMADVTDLITVLSKADDSSLFDGIFLGFVKEVYFDVCIHINTLLSALSASRSELELRVENANGDLLKIESEGKKMLASVDHGCLSEKAGHVMHQLEVALYNSIDELVVLARRGEAAMSRGVVDMVRSTLTLEIHRLVHRITKDVAYKFSGCVSLEGVSISADENWVDNMISIIENEAMNTLLGFEIEDDRFSGKNKEKVGQGKAVGGVLASVAMVIPNPVLKVVFAILPGVVGALFDVFREKNEREQYRKIISSQVIPSVLSQVRTQVMDSLNVTESEIIRVVSDELSSKIESQKKIYDEVFGVVGGELEVVKHKISEVEIVRTEINEAASRVFML